VTLETGVMMQKSENFSFAITEINYIQKYIQIIVIIFQNCCFTVDLIKKNATLVSIRVFFQKY